MEAPKKESGLTLEQAQRIWDVLLDIYGRKHGTKLTAVVTPKKGGRENG